MRFWQAFIVVSFTPPMIRADGFVEKIVIGLIMGLVWALWKYIIDPSPTPDAGGAGDVT